MLTDLTVSDQFMQEYKKVKGDKLLSEKEGIETHFYVLSQASWPILPQEKKIQIPKTLFDI